MAAQSGLSGSNGPGSMIGLNVLGARGWLSKSANPSRKLPYCWEFIEVDLGARPQ
jgi:sugar fermentation stimulation protein A